MTHDDAYRILPARDGWWALTANRAAHLPSEGAYEGRLSTKARRLLDNRGLGAEAVSAKRYVLTVLTSTACNLGCQYCSQNISTSVDSAPPRIPRQTLSTETIDEIVAFAERQQRLTGRSELHLLLFGGEPLLNPAACFALMTALTPRNLRTASMISNCALLTPQLATALGAAGLANIQVTFDGDETQHDRARVTRDGHPTFRTIMCNVHRALQVSTLSFHVQINVTRANLLTLDSLVDELAQLPERGRLSFDLVLVDDVEIGFSALLSYADAVEPVKRAYSAAIAAGIKITPTSPTALCPFCNETGGAVGAVINPDGTLYSCWETAGRAGMEVGTIRGGDLTDPASLADRWVACDYQARPKSGALGRSDINDAIDAFVLDEQREHHRLVRAGHG